MSQKRPKNGQKWRECALFVSNTSKTKNRSHLGLCGSKPNSEGTYSTRNPPLFVVSKLQNRATRRLDSRTSGLLVEEAGSKARAKLVRTAGPPGSPGRKNCSKTFRDHWGDSNKFFWPVLCPWRRVLGHGKSQNALKMGCFNHQKRVKNESKTHFSKLDPGPFPVLKKVS